MTSRRSPQTLEGLGVSPGVAIGRAVCIESQPVEVYRFPLPQESVEAEVERFSAATRQAESELAETRDKASQKLGDELAAIFDAQSLLLADSSFLNRVEERIRNERVNAEWAVHKAAEELTARFESLEDKRFRERGEDLRDVTRYLLRALQGVAHHNLAEMGSDVIIIAHDLTPSEAVRLGRQHVVAFAVETGGQTSHTAIIARDLNIPLVTGVSGVTHQVTDDDPVIVDGTQGRVLLHPSREQLDEHREIQRQLSHQELELLSTESLPCVTRDGIEVHLMANLDLPEEIVDAKRFGAHGVGLYRSEFLYIENSPHLPTEQGHMDLYGRILDAVDPDPVVIRTFDLGGRKLAREVMETEEDNPVLGLRGIRLTLARPQIFRTQLRALYRAGVGRNLCILLPMVSNVAEIHQFKDFAGKIQDELLREGLDFNPDCKLGIMIEVPSAALVADILAAEVDFFSIGTNDLIQYALAVDRNNEHVSYLYRPLHPAILRMLRFVIDSAAGAGIDVSMCGEMAGDRHYAPLLLGMGLRRLSISPRAIPEVKTQIRALSLSDLEGVVGKCLTMASADDVESCLETFLSQQSVVG
jgi:phosphotransferase system enzyme I (PtsI)